MKSLTLKRTLLSLLVVALLGATFSTGCYDRVELEGMAFVVGLGLDKGPNNTIDVTVRIAVPGEMAGNNGSSSNAAQLGGSRPITVRANTIAGALTLLNSTVERQVSLLHLATILIGENVAKAGVLDYVGPLVRMREFRRTVTFFVVPGEAREIFETNQPVLEKSMSRFHESISEISRHTGLSVTSKIHEFIVESEEPNEDPVAPVMAVNEKVKEQTQQSQKDTREETMPGQNVSFKPGELVRMGGNSLDFIGTGVFRGDKLVTYLDGIETRMLLMIRGELLRTQMDFPDPQQKGKYEVIELKHARTPQTEIKLDSDPIQIKIRQKLEGDLIGVQSSIDYTEENNMRVLENSVRETLKQKEQDLMEHLYHDYQAAPFGMFRKIRSQFSTIQEMEQYPFREKLKTAQVTVDIDLNIRRIGVQLAPVGPK
ncbi:Ger(x)C family spore germination protein [Tumebacillus permanentifrigoris]|uniref:Ger(X)C family germination protein n=1 Tax=Tumebacillus permanentifrigoris TaxID=378543 RepID=A0A316D9E2_9BACL|nr:Ger(x)C family spore germination protein [Tumebacillus permanentifrigoris]PWK12848.1 Ger(x)C family germination protein [Tumebacillus permanentifrigoris]